MYKKALILLLVLTIAILSVVPESFARSQYIPSLTTVYGDGSCGTCHVRASGGGPRNSYGILFENQANHATDPAAALTAIGPPPASPTPDATSTTALKETPIPPASTSVATETPAETAKVTETVIPSAPGFGILVSLAGLFVCAYLARSNNK